MFVSTFSTAWIALQPKLSWRSRGVGQHRFLWLVGDMKIDLDITRCRQRRPYRYGSGPVLLAISYSSGGWNNLKASAYSVQSQRTHPKNHEYVSCRRHLRLCITAIADLVLSVRNLCPLERASTRSATSMGLWLRKREAAHGAALLYAETTEHYLE